MADLADDLRGALDEPAPVPSNGRELVRYAGGVRALTEQLSGMSGPPRRGSYADPAAYKAASNRWRSANRRAQRASDEGKPGKQTRGNVKGVRLTSEQRERVGASAVQRKYNAFVKHGARVRIRAIVAVGTPTPGRPADVRERDLPAGGPAVRLTPDEIIPVLAAVEDGDDQQGAFDLLVAFGEAYGWDLDNVEIREVLELKIWPDGEDEPA